MNDDKVESGLGELRDRVGKLERGLAENTAATNQIKSDTGEIVEMFRSAKGGFRVLGALGGMLKWAVGIGVSLTGIWIAIKGGVK